MPEILKNRKVAWGITACVVALSVFLGAWSSYSGARGDIADVFEDEIAPLVSQALVPAFNVQTLAANYLNATEIAGFGISSIVDDIQAANNPLDIHRHYNRLYTAVRGVYDHLATLETSETNQNFINNYLRNFLEIDLIMHQAGYNNLAREFNTALGQNLGPLVRIVVSEMPVFE